MARVENVTQCRLRSGRDETVAWIDATAATRGARVTIEGWDGAWEVVETYSTIPWENLQEKQARDRNAFSSIGKVR
jgi:hypothetical protein